MTRAERETIRKALKLIMADDADFHAGVSMLAELAGLTYPANDILKTARRMDIRTLAARSNSTFRVSHKG